MQVCPTEQKSVKVIVCAAFSPVEHHPQDASRQPWGHRAEADAAAAKAAAAAAAAQAAELARLQVEARAERARKCATVLFVQRLSLLHG